MTLVDTEDLADRTCRTCGAVVWDRVAHARFHRGIDAGVAALESVRSLLVAFEAELTIREERELAALAELEDRRR